VQEYRIGGSMNSTQRGEKSFSICSTTLQCKFLLAVRKREREGEKGVDTRIDAKEHSSPVWKKGDPEKRGYRN